MNWLIYILLVHLMDMKVRNEMSNEKQLATIPPRDQIVIFVLDPSAGCGCERINTINRAMREAIFQLYQIQTECQYEYCWKITVLEAGREARWFSEMPVAVNDFVWQDLRLGMGPMNWEAALLELNSKLNRKSMMNSETGSTLPIIIFIANSSPDWSGGKEQLQANKWFKYAAKYAITEDMSCVEALKELIRNPKQCFKLEQMDQLCDVLLETLRQAMLYIAIDPTPYREPQFCVDEGLDVGIEPLEDYDDLWTNW